MLLYLHSHYSTTTQRTGSLQRFLTDWFSSSPPLHSHLIPLSPQFHFSSPLGTIHATLRLHQRGFVSRDTRLNQTQSDKFPATGHFSVRSKSQIYFKWKTMFAIHITWNWNAIFNKKKKKKTKSSVRPVEKFQNTKSKFLHCDKRLRKENNIQW